MVRHLPVTEVRRHLGEVIKRIRINKDYFVLEKDGIPVAGLMDIDEFEDYLELHDTKLEKQKATLNTKKARPGLPEPSSVNLESLGNTTSHVLTLPSPYHSYL